MFIFVWVSFFVVAKEEEKKKNYKFKSGREYYLENKKKCGCKYKHIACTALQNGNYMCYPVTTIGSRSYKPFWFGDLPLLQSYY